MPDWRDTILHELPPDVSPLTVVYDPDSLLREQTILDNLRERGFEILEFEETIRFRFAYETQFRVKWDEGESTQVLILVQGSPDSEKQLPFDVLFDARTLQFSLEQLFPQLYSSVVKCLEPSDYDVLYHAVIS